MSNANFSQNGNVVGIGNNWTSDKWRRRPAFRDNSVNKDINSLTFGELLQDMQDCDSRMQRCRLTQCIEWIDSGSLPSASFSSFYSQSSLFVVVVVVVVVLPDFKASLICLISDGNIDYKSVWLTFRKSTRFIGSFENNFTIANPLKTVTTWRLWQPPIYECFFLLILFI